MTTSVPASEFRLPTFLRVVWLVLRKDLAVEWRSREILYTTTFFALACMLIFAFGLVREGTPPPDVAAAILWIAIAFAGTLALGRAFERERQNATLRALLLVPAERAALYVGKLAGILCLMAAIELIVVPLTGLLFGAPLLKAPLMTIAIVALGTLGFAVVGALFAAMLVRAHSRDVLLPVLLYPMAVPVLIAGVRGTAALFQAETDLATARMWLAMLGFFDAVFLTLALWTFEPVMTE